MAIADPLGDRLGLNVPYEWWPGVELLAEIEEAGFDWVQLPAPPSSVLSDTRNCIRHARAVAAALGATGLRAVLHAPGDLMAGTPAPDRAIAGALSYAAECGAEQVVYHEVHPPRSQPAELARVIRAGLGVLDDDALDAVAGGPAAVDPLL